MTKPAFLQRLQGMGWGIAILAVTLTGCFGDRVEIPEPQPKTTNPVTLESSAFAPDAMIPAQYTCTGDNISPPLAWGEVPPETRSLALVMDDPDAPGGTFVHWVMYGLPPETRQLAPALPGEPTLPSGGSQGKSSFGKTGYGGPCPPSGTHRYSFRLYALDKPVDLPPGATKAELFEAINGSVLAIAQLIGRYSKP